MRVIIIGCGRVGAGVAENLNLRGHLVTMVDNDPSTFERLGPSFKGQTVVGAGFDRDVLHHAGIERADGLAALTSSDEVNVVAARLAKEIYHVPRVVARVYDPRKAEIYRRLGLQTVSPVILATSRLTELLTFSELNTIVSLGSGDVALVETEIPLLLAGRTVNELTVSTEVNVVAITRAGKTFLPSLNTTFQRGDIIHLALLVASADRLRSLLGW